jgi:cell wall-associated NlpC family hydrolase
MSIAGAVGASTALAGGTGGVAAAEPATKTTKPAPPLHLAPITAKTPSIAYKGPVYEKTESGEIVSYQPPTKAGDTTGTAASSTGGIVAATSESAASALALTIPGELTTGDGMTSATGPTPRPELLVPGSTARFVDGLAAAPMGAPAVIQEIIWAGNEVIGLPYIYGGGHASFISPGYDCSGTVSFALHGADLLASPEDSSEFEVWGSHGAGRWVAIFANAGHAYMTVAGLRLDTSPAEDPSNLEGPRWRPLRQTNAGFVVRHPLGL